MDPDREIPVVFEHGVLRPELPLDLPENTRWLASVRPADDRAKSTEEFLKHLRELRQRAGLSTSGWRFDRDNLYDRA